MSARQATPKETEVRVLTRSRRRCCICYGLNRDESTKKGQLAHLDRDATNYDFDNLAYMCLEHHDEYDSKTSQSKGWSDVEAKQYRNELYERFSFWGEGNNFKHLLNFLGFTVDLDDMLDAALEAAGEITWMNERVLEETLSSEHIEYTDVDLWQPLLYVLNYLQSWGWLNFEYKEKKQEGGEVLVSMLIKHKPICKQLLELLKKRQNSDKKK